MQKHGRSTAPRTGGEGRWGWLFGVLAGGVLVLALALSFFQWQDREVPVAQAFSPVVQVAMKTVAEPVRLDDPVVDGADVALLPPDAPADQRLTTAESMPDAAAPAVAKGGSTGSLGQEFPAAEEQHQEVLPDPQHPMMGGPGFTVDQLPDCSFTRQALALAPEARARVEVEMQANPFPRLDLNSRQVDQNGMIFYQCRFPALDETLAASWPALEEPEIGKAALPVSPFPSALKWHSNPGATRVIFVDFDGHVITNTVWNGSGDDASWNCRAYSVDADETTYSDTEQALMLGIWQRMAEDYAPFNVDVTTEQPAAWTSTTGHCLITKTTDKNGRSLPHNGYGGIAYVNVFGQSYYSYNYAGKCYSPAWVTEYASMYSAEAGSHEIGHNLGLSHDGKTGSEYYSGHVIASGSSYTWNAIMGGGVTPDISQWSKGEYYDASNTAQDDLAVLSAKLPYRTDSVGDTNAAAAALGLVGTTVSQTGIIERNTDTDVYSFSTGTGAITLNATTYRYSSSDWGANLDMKLELYNSVGAQVASNDPTNEIQPTVNYTVPTAGVYYLHVKPAAQGSPASSPPNGYTVYGCLGNYTLSGTIVVFQYSVDFQTDGTPGSSITGDLSQEISPGGDCTAVTANAPVGYELANWTGSGFTTSTSNPLTVTNVTQDLTITANFAPATYTVSFQAGTGGNISSGTTQVVEHGQDASPVTATPSTGYRFVKWTKGGSDYSTDNPLTITGVTEDLTFVANFALNEYIVTFIADPALGGTVNGVAALTETVLHGGDSSEVTAAAAAAHLFTGWVGDGEFGMTNPVQFTSVTGALTVTATFLDTAGLDCLACGSKLTVNESELAAAIDEFTKKPKIYAVYYDPVKALQLLKPKKAGVKVLSKVSIKAPLTAVAGEWTKKIRLYDVKAFVAERKLGTDAVTWLGAHRIDPMPMPLRLKTKEPVVGIIEEEIRTVLLGSPEIADVVVSDDAGVTILTITGKYFGVKAPKVWLEYDDPAGGTPLKTLKLKALKPTGDYLDNKGKPACMDPETGDSKVIVVLPANLPKGVNAWTDITVLALENGVGMAAWTVIWP